MLRLFFGILIVVSILGCSRSQKPQLDSSIRTVKWDSLLAKDKQDFRIDTASTDTIYEQGNFYDIVKDSEPAGYFGNPYYKTQYFDLNHDGKEDAVVLLSVPGSGAYADALIFLQTLNGPKFSGYAGGAHFMDSLYGDTLDIITAHWLRNDAHCCEGAHDHQRIIGHGDTVQFLPLQVIPLKGSAQYAVSEFYDALADSGMYAFARDKSSNKLHAYNMLSDFYRASHPYAQWLKGYANTISVVAEVDENSPDSAVRVKITSQDKIGNEIVTKQYAGVWHVKFITNNLPDGDSTAVADWFLDRPEIHEVKE